jgi:hypothetical protein
VTMRPVRTISRKGLPSTRLLKLSFMDEQALKLCGRNPQRLYAELDG